MVRIVTCAMTISLLCTPLQAADQEAGKTLYSNNCAQCHGPTAKGMASFPSLAGRDANYLKSRLETYRAGERVGANSALMIPNARDLSDEDIANLSEFISQNFE